MTVILRLEGLDVEAGAEHIRAFFKELHIPDGGVYIIGGRLREAFIAFGSERDAQLAMRRTGNLLKGSEVTLYVSSMAELERRLESLFRKKKKSSQLTVQRPAAKPSTLSAPEDLTVNPPSSPVWPQDPDTANLPLLSTPQQPVAQNLDSGTAFLLGICTVLQGLQSSPQVELNNTADSPKAAVLDNSPEQTLDSRPGYVRLFGLPASTTKEDICRFFTGLTVQEAIVNVQLGVNHGCLVKFANMQDARDALDFNQQLLGHICVEVRGATEKMWNGALQECELALKGGERLKPEKKPQKENHKQKSSLPIKKRAVNQLPSEPPKKPKLTAASTPPSSPPGDHTIIVSKLPKDMNKTEIKILFGCPNLSNKKVLHLLDKKGNTTDTAFVTFDRTADYEYALNLSGCHVGTSAIEVSSISKQKMAEKLATTRALTRLKTGWKPKQKLGSAEKRSKQAAQTCLFVRNLPAHVQASHINGLFRKYKLNKDSVVVLRDGDGNGLGEAVVQFESEAVATLAHRMHGKTFLGTKLLFTRISEKQMEEILTKHV
ncbi:RNA binding motif protein 12Ba [Stegastes partitus]|uniref:RNA-binding protein 12B-like n=1 Tax=Stegastes partitus TaxID=144197 RepID=A0A9Y4K4N3_9TELE|nr:PREDICTED: RNA-binding protein 12B-like [Stegastes partitus]XP_008288146.1 PREDICTED: RNA-binding protein 12B-like [Stegastes partitus]